jgi:DNA repair protein RecN (Recombination protein N)
MLEELRVENLLLLERAELRLAPGLNVVTGETGAGKTLLAHALDLLLGGRARKGIVRSGAAEAYVEGIFSLPAQLLESELIPADAEELVLARRVWPDGRTRAYVCGRSATVGDLRDLGSRLLAFYGQHEHRKLMLGSAQLEILDARCGSAQAERRRATATAYERVHTLQMRVAELRAIAGARDRELDLLSFELREIESAALADGEKDALEARRDRLRHLETLVSAARGAEQAISGEDGSGAAERLGEAAGRLEPAAAIDQPLRGLIERLDAVRHECEDIGAELRAYASGLADGDEEDAPPEVRLQAAEERLALLNRLERKHGGTVADVLSHAERCRARIAELEGAEVALEDAERELAAAEADLERLAKELTAARRKAAPALAAAVRERLAELAMPEAGFEVVLGERAEGSGPRGADAVEMMIATNPGVPPGQLREVASGGELSRVMLALLSVAHAGGKGAPDEQPLLVFDEVDAGIGGHTANAVGEHLRSLAEGRQVLCITHLPQVAAQAARHFTIAKDTATEPARTTVATLEQDAVVGELVRMLGAGDGDRAATQHARQMLRAA